MQLLVMVVDQENALDEIFEAFIKIGIKGVTVFDSWGSGHLFNEDISIFGKLSRMAAGRKKHNKTIFSIIEDSSKLEEAIEVAEKIVGEMKAPQAAVTFTLPLGIVRGLPNLL